MLSPTARHTLGLLSDVIGHHCGLAFLRLRQPLSYFSDRYRDPAWGLRKLYLLMEKQHNRGQDGAGVGVVKFDMPPGAEYIKRVRSEKHNAIERVFDIVMEAVNAFDEKETEHLTDGELKQRGSYLGEAYLGHLRYGTHSVNARSAAGSWISIWLLCGRQCRRV